ncbi:hypothetical protein [Salinisphaera orenii]|uniref:hypothetical protein n=1 Tax=Salinisphaera orenii TaxID=856731 RepID=UPI001955102B
MSRPHSVTRALWLFWAMIGLAIPKLAITLLVPAKGQQHGVAIVSFLAVFGLIALANIYIAKQTSWARGIVCVLFLVGITPQLPIVMTHIERMPVIGTLTLLQFVAGVVGLFLVYREPAASWFKPPNRS